jgi:hypothetical protein
MQPQMRSTDEARVLPGKQDQANIEKLGSAHMPWSVTRAPCRGEWEKLLKQRAFVFQNARHG